MHTQKSLSHSDYLLLFPTPIKYIKTLTSCDQSNPTYHVVLSIVTYVLFSINVPIPLKGKNFWGEIQLYG